MEKNTLSNHIDQLYCKSCYGKAFGPRVLGFGLSSPALGIETDANELNSNETLKVNNNNNNNENAKTENGIM